MQKNGLKLITIGYFLALTGCTGFGVMETSDPKSKLANASELFDQQNRPLLAEKLIKEAIDLCEKKSDLLCLANSYRTYGFFFRSKAIENWEKYYQEKGFIDASATFNNRFFKSIEYFKKSHELYTKLERFDALTNVNLNMAFTYTLIKEYKMACQAFDASGISNRENLRKNPNAKIFLPKGFSSYEDYLAQEKKSIQCE